MYITGKHFKDIHHNAMLMVVSCFKASPLLSYLFTRHEQCFSQNPPIFKHVNSEKRLACGLKVLPKEMTPTNPAP